MTGLSSDSVSVAYADITGKPALVSGSAQIADDISGSFNAASSSFSTRVAANEVITARALVSSSAQIASDISGSSTTLASSIAGRVAANEVITARALVSSSAGHITSSGNISSSGDVITSDITLDGTITHTGDADTKIGFDTDVIQFKAGNNGTNFRVGGIEHSGHITASGNISASKVNATHTPVSYTHLTLPTKA